MSFRNFIATMREKLRDDRRGSRGEISAETARALNRIMQDLDRRFGERPHRQHGATHLAETEL